MNGTILKLIDGENKSNKITINALKHDKVLLVYPECDQ